VSDIESAAPPRGWPGATRSILVSTGLLVVSAALAILLLEFGAAGHHATAGTVTAPPSAASPLLRLLVALPVILAACHVVGMLLRLLGQPAVIGEIIAGVILGPSLLGQVWPAASHWLFPPGVVATVSTLAQLGLVFFMYLIGAEINLGLMRRRGATAVTVSQASIALPMLSGIALGFWLYPSFGRGSGFVAFTLFIAVAMSVTAFPVLARILADRGIADTPLGALALMCAAIVDVVAWCLLAVVTAISRQGPASRAVLTIALIAVFAAAMLLVARPLLARLLGAVPEAAVLPILLAGILLSALVTDEIGIDTIFGAFLFGVITPRSVSQAGQAAKKLESLTLTLLLPLFFAYTGLHTRLGLLGANGRLWAWCAVIIVVAVVGKWGGATAAARLAGTGWHESLSLGALMNCRGLTELVVLTVGLEMNVISPTVFALLLIMTVVSTGATAPGLSRINRLYRDQPAAAVAGRR
jgi:K+:H+ antiporter